MAKGDDSRARNENQFESDRARNNIGNLRTVKQNQYNQFMGPAERAREIGFNDYGNIMGQYGEFAKTGGISPLDAANLRQRALSPIRSVYAGANREVDRSRALQGGYSPGFGVLKARMAREQSSNISDAASNAEAALTEMRNQGKLAGLAGMSNIYGQAPGMAGLYGNQQLAAGNQLTDVEQLDWQRANDNVRNRIAIGNMPGKWEHNIGRMNDIFDLGKKVVGGWQGGLKTQDGA